MIYGIMRDSMEMSSGALHRNNNHNKTLVTMATYERINLTSIDINIVCPNGQIDTNVQFEFDGADFCTQLKRASLKKTLEAKNHPTNTMVTRRVTLPTLYQVLNCATCIHIASNVPKQSKLIVMYRRINVK